jgi:hypothetical protein
MMMRLLKQAPATFSRAGAREITGEEKPLAKRGSVIQTPGGQSLGMEIWGIGSAFGIAVPYVDLELASEQTNRFVRSA